MKEEHRDAFINSCQRFFRRQRISCSAESHSDYFKFLWQKFLKRHHGIAPYITPTGKIPIASKFIIRATADYLNTDAETVNEMFSYRNPLRQVRFRKFNLMPRKLEDLFCDVRYIEERVKAEKSRLLSEKKHLIQRIGRRSQAHFKVTHSDGSPLSPTSKASFISSTAQTLREIDVGFSPVKPTTARKPRVRAVAERGDDEYERDMVGSKATIWRRTTPVKPGADPSPYRLKRDPEHKDLKPIRSGIAALLAEAKPDDNFQFEVTLKDIESRLGVPRGISQKRVMGGFTAKDVYEAAGMAIKGKTGRDYHWAHRQGWAMGGEQVKANLDPTTGGSNFDTLFKVEAPIYNLLTIKKAEKVCVQGTVEFDPESGLPYKITYRLRWGLGSEIEVLIDPTSSRKPTLDEHVMAKAVMDYEAAASPHQLKWGLGGERDVPIDRRGSLKPILAEHRMPRTALEHEVPLATATQSMGL